MGKMGSKNFHKFNAILIASILLFSTVSISSLLGSSPIPQAYAGGGGGGGLIGLTCDITLISSDDEGSDSAMTFWESEGIFLWASFRDLYRLTLDGDKTFIGFMNHDTRGLAFSLDGNTLYSIEARNDQLHIVDPTDASPGSSTTITLAGKSVNGGGGLATHPTTGELWALLRISGEGRVLVTIDPDTGVATSIGNTGIKTAGIAFDSSGTLFAISASGAGLSNSIFTVNTSNASLTFVCSNGPGFSGVSIAHNPNDGALYLSINDSQFFKFNGGLINQCETTNISTESEGQGTAMTFWNAEGVFLWASFGELFELTIDGVKTFVGTIILNSHHPLLILMNKQRLQNHLFY